MRAKTVIADRESQSSLRRGARSACRPSHASTSTAEGRTTNTQCRERRKKDIRTLTVCMLLRQRSSRRSGPDRVPFLRVSGQWLEQCGFAIGARYYVTVAQGKLMLTLAEPNGTDEPIIGVILRKGPNSVTAMVEGVTPFFLYRTAHSCGADGVVNAEPRDDSRVSYPRKESRRSATAE